VSSKPLIHISTRALITLRHSLIGDPTTVWSLNRYKRWSNSMTDLACRRANYVQEYCIWDYNIVEWLTGKQRPYYEPPLSMQAITPTCPKCKAMFDHVLVARDRDLMRDSEGKLTSFDGRGMFGGALRGGPPPLDERDR
jgi:hypothetical protein